MYYDKRTTTRMKKISSRILFMFMLLLVMVPAGFAQDKTSTTKNETESQEVFIENRVAELEAKLQSVKEQIDEVKQPETESVRLQYGISEDELNKYAQLLEETEAVIQQQITAIKKQASLQ